MKITAYSPALLPELTRLVNRNMAPIAPGWTFRESGLAAILENPLKSWDIHYPEITSPVETKTICVLNQGQVLAAAEWGRDLPMAPDEHALQPDKSWISWIVAEPDREALRLLLDTLVTQARNAGCAEINSTRFAFGMGWLGFPAPWSNLTEAFLGAGFSQSNCWSILTGPTRTTSIEPPRAVNSMQVSWQVDEVTGERDLSIREGDQLVGECEAWDIPQHLTDGDGHRDWTTIEWLGVEAGYRRKGIGRWLLQEQLRRQAERGIQQAMLWTEAENYPTLRLCESLGFRKSFYSLEFRYTSPNICSFKSR